MNKEHFKIAIKNLRTRSLRSWLTILGVIIGIFLVIALLSLSEGIKNAILVQLDMIGENVLMVIPGEGGDIMTAMMGGLMLTDENIRAIKKAEGVDLVAPVLWRAKTVRHKGEMRTVFLFGYSVRESQDFFIENMGFSLTQGYWLRPGKREVTVGHLVPREIFPGMKIGDEIIIEGKSFKVAGVLRSIGNRQDDSMVGIDLEYFHQATGIKDGAHIASVRTKENFTPDQVRANIIEELEETKKRRRGVEDVPPFTVFTREAAIDMVEDIMLLLQVLVFGIASISIIVSGIGIANTMYTSVRERTKEIGIIKAIGAKNSDITKIFLIESGIIGLIGGIGGIILGLGLAQLVEIYFRINPVFALEAVISPTLIIFGLLFAFLVGCLSGFLPARKAANLNPVDALRYE
jgi:putative ABC transport system permease protein